MKYRKLGTTGMDVSPICLGCMSYGVPSRGGHPWSLDDEAARPFIQRALDGGINFFDTANVYSDGTSEEIVGRALADFASHIGADIVAEGIESSEQLFALREAGVRLGQGFFLGRALPLQGTGGS